MGKVKRTITLDSELNDQLKELPQINVSGFCNIKLKEYVAEENKK